MKLLTVLLASALTITTFAAMLAPDLPDGVYHAYVDDNGVEKHTRLTRDHLAPLTWTYDSRYDVVNASISTADLYNIELLQDATTNAATRLTVHYQTRATWTAEFTVAAPPPWIMVIPTQRLQTSRIKSGAKTTLTKGDNYYSIRGDVVAFVCVWESRGFWIDGRYIGDILGKVTTDCGAYTAGTWKHGFVNDKDPGFDIGYMSHSPGLDFCKAALASTSQCC